LNLNLFKLLSESNRKNQAKPETIKGLVWEAEYNLETFNFKFKGHEEIFKRCVELCKQYPRGFYLKEDKKWCLHFPIYRLEKEKMKEICRLLQNPEILKNNLEKNVQKLILSQHDYTADSYPISFEHKLFDFQKEAINFIYNNCGKALLAMTMGTGKTIVALGYIDKVGFDRILIVCPASLKIHWQRHIESWLKEKSFIVNSGKDEIPDERFVIVNYDLLVKLEERLKEYKPELIVFDEIHFIKNQNAKRSQAAKNISIYSRFKIGLTGTPILNRPTEIWNPIKTLDANLLPGFWTFARRYTYIQQTRWGVQFIGAKNLDELREFLKKTIVYRKTLEEISEFELPPFKRILVPIPKTKAMRMLDESLLKSVIKGRWTREKFSKVMTSLSEFRQKALEIKLPFALEFVESLLENEDRIVIFLWHKKAVEALKQFCNKRSIPYSILIGETPIKARQKEVDKFQNGESKVFIGNIIAAGVGLQLTAASTAVFLEVDWVPGNLIQAEKRLHRIGTRKFVKFYYLVLEGTIEERMIKLLNKKAEIAHEILDKDNLGDYVNLFKELLEV